MRLINTIIFLCLIVSACQEPKKNTIGDLDVTNEFKNQSNIFIKPKTDDDIRNAYTEYLKHTTKDDSSRMNAINRLAELEFELSDRLQQERENLKAGDNSDDDLDEKLYDARLNKTIELLETSLSDYPSSKNNDNILYQLSKAYDQNDAHEKSITSLHALVKDYPKSSYYIEAQFRLAEEFFSKRDYLSAEDAYTEVIIAQKNDVFFEKALFKRGWSRFKQELYLISVDDFLRAISYHEFNDYNSLNKTDKDQFNEYFRAIGLSFSYLGGAKPLHDYFKDNDDFKYTYYAYSIVSDIYLKQERFSDSVDTLEQFIKYYPKSRNIPNSHLSIIGIWKKSGFNHKLYKAIDTFYLSYNPNSKYWKKNNADNNIRKIIGKSLKEYVLLVSAHFHNKYQSSHKTSDFKNSDIWYKRYLKHYSNYARKDNIYYLYAELLSANKRYNTAIKYYELAAYDNELLINKKASYATIVLTNRLYKISKDKNKKSLMDKHISYALLFSQMYPKDKRSVNIIMHASELAYTSRQYEKSIELTELIPDRTKPAIRYNANIIKAQSFFNLKQYPEAESIYLSMLQFGASRNGKDKINDKLALAIYKQAEHENKNNNLEAATEHYLRIVELAPTSTIAATGLYDAIAINMDRKQYSHAIAYINKFKKLYPNHKYKNDVIKKLSVAYLNSNQSIKAAKEFERISSFSGNNEIKMAALWQAAELYELKNDKSSAIRSYSDYVKRYKKPYPQYIEAMSKLVSLYTIRKNTKSTSYWQNKIIKADKIAIKKSKNDRTKFIVSTASINQAKNNYSLFKRYKLIKPLKANLRKKKKAMQLAVRLYGQASIYGISEIATEATHSIANIYNEFSQSLLNSERPGNLTEDELEQYEILLEDQAFPFEEKAIEFYETNLSHIRDGVYNSWVKKSHAQLKILFPVRYERKPKIDSYINVIY